MLSAKRPLLIKHGEQTSYRFGTNDPHFKHYGFFSASYCYFKLISGILSVRWKFPICPIDIFCCSFNFLLDDDIQKEFDLVVGRHWVTVFGFCFRFSRFFFWIRLLTKLFFDHKEQTNTVNKFEKSQARGCMLRVRDTSGTCFALKSMLSRRRLCFQITFAFTCGHRKRFRNGNVWTCNEFENGWIFIRFQIYPDTYGQGLNSFPCCCAWFQRSKYGSVF